MKDKRLLIKNKFQFSKNSTRKFAIRTTLKIESCKANTSSQKVFMRSIKSHKVHKHLLVMIIKLFFFFNFGKLLNLQIL